MKMFSIGLIGCLWTALTSWGQSPEIYGRPQWGKQIIPPSDAYGRANFTREDERQRRLTSEALC